VQNYKNIYTISRVFATILLGYLLNTFWRRFFLPCFTVGQSTAFRIITSKNSKLSVVDQLRKYNAQMKYYKESQRMQKNSDFFTIK